MRVLLSTWGSRGDVEPLVGLAMQVQGLGGQVRMCAPPDDEFVTLLAEAGVPMVPLGPAVHSIVAGERPLRDRAFSLADELVDARFEVLSEAARDCDVIVASGLMPAGARSVAESLGVRYVCAAMHVFGMPSPHFAPGRRPGTQSNPEETDLEVLWNDDAQRVNTLYGPAENRHRASLGLPPLDNVRDHALTRRPWLAADPVLCPAAGMTHLDVVQTGAWVRPDDRPLPDAVEAFLQDGPPPVYVGFGSIVAQLPADAGQVAVSAARSLGRRVVLGRGWAGLDVAADDDVLAVDEINQQALFARMAAVVHHGGAGTTATAARAGAPQVIVPQMADQPYWGSRVAELGIGAAHDGPRATLESLTTVLAAALLPGTSVRAQSVAADMRSDGAAVAARMLLAGDAMGDGINDAMGDAMDDAMDDAEPTPPTRR